MELYAAKVFNFYFGPKLKVIHPKSGVLEAPGLILTFWGLKIGKIQTLRIIQGRVLIRGQACRVGRDIPPRIFFDVDSPPPQEGLS